MRKADFGVRNEEKGVFYRDKGDEVDESWLCGLSSLCVEIFLPQRCKVAKEYRRPKEAVAIQNPWFS